METLHIYLTDGHESAGWNKAGTTHRITVMEHGKAEITTDYHSRDMAMLDAYALHDAAEAKGQPTKIHDLTGRG